MSVVTLRSLFEFNPSHIERATKQMADELQEAEGARSSLVGFAAETAAKKLNETLDTDVFEILSEAWLKFQQVRDCADPSKHPANQDTIVPLRDVEITSTNTPLLHMTVGGVSLPDLRFTLELTAKFQTLQILVRDARICAIRPGACSAIARLKYGSVKLAEQATPEWKIPGVISLGEGIPIPRFARRDQVASVAPPT